MDPEIKKKQLSASLGLDKPVFKEDLVIMLRNIQDLQHDVRKLNIRTEQVDGFQEQLAEYEFNN